MADTNKQEWSPLLAPGLHVMNLDKLRMLCLNSSGFNLSTTRGQLMEGLGRVLERIGALKGADVWIDGSFLTWKINPEDIDLVVLGDWERLNEEKAYRDACEWLTNTEPKTVYHCHTFVAFPNQPLIGEQMSAYWRKQWGLARNGIAKGIAVLKVGELL